MFTILKNFILYFMPIELFEHLRFDIRSKLGRLLSRSLKLNSKNANFINLGSGNSYENNFINVDIFGNKLSITVWI